MTLAVEEVFSSVRGPVGNKVDLIPKAILGTDSKWYFFLVILIVTSISVGKVLVVLANSNRRKFLVSTCF